jgi:hypothetical protein
MFPFNTVRLSNAIRAAVCVITLGISLSAVPSVHAATPSQTGSDVIYAVTAANRLVSFSSSNPCKIVTNARIRGLQPGERIMGIDFRPANGKLYGLGSTSRIYVLDPKTNWATAVGTQPFSVTLSGSAFGFDFNPAVDRIRIVSNNGQNLRVHPDTGAVVATDKPLNYINAPTVKTTIVGAAYTNPDTDPTTPTALYDIDAGFDLLALQSPPNDGVLSIVGVNNVNSTALTGFDISKANVGYAAVLRGGIGTDGDLDLDAWVGGELGDASSPNCGASRLVTIDLKTGVATEIGAIGTLAPVRALAVQL